MNSVVKFFESLPQLKNEKRQQLIVQLVGVAATTTVLYASYRMIVSSSNKRSKGLKEIPSPKSSYPYIGHMFSLGEIPAKTISKWHAELGPIIKLKMGVITWIIVDDPALAHKVFVSNGAETSYRPESYYCYHHYGKDGKGISFAQPGGGLKENRSAALTVLAPNLINEHYLDSIKEETRNLAFRLIKSSETESGTDPLKDLELSSINVVLSACFGKKYKSIKDPEFNRLSGAAETSMRLGGSENELSHFLPVISLLDYFFSSQVEMREFIQNQRDPLFKDLIKEAATREGPNVVKSLVENGFNFSEDEKIVLFSDLINAGTDTISVSLHWNFAIMCHHPEVQKKVSAEIDRFIEKNDRLPEFSEREQVPYCISVIKESMRYRPTTPFGLPHAVRKDVEVDGYIIPKGATVVANMLSIHTNPELYPDPRTFNPERFLSNLKTMQSAANGKFEERDHFNFGFGRRVCPGIYLAEIELFYAFIHVFARATIEPVNQMPDIESMKNGGITLNALAYKVKFVKRQDALI